MEGHWLRRPKADVGSTVAIFVHGLLSNTQRCWRNDNGSYWPQLVSDETGLADIGVYAFEYQTDVFSGNYNLDDVVDFLKEKLVIDHVLMSARIIFVCHSMGGIIVRKYILQQSAFLTEAGKEIGIFLVASPSLGSDYANWLGPLAALLGHSQAASLRFCQSNSWLADEKISEVVMPILGSGHGGIGPPLALVGLLLAIAEAARYGQGGQRPKKVTLVVFKRDAEALPEVDHIVVRRALALIGTNRK